MVMTFVRGRVGGEEHTSREARGEAIGGAIGGATQRRRGEGRDEEGIGDLLRGKADEGDEGKMVADFRRKAKELVPAWVPK